MAMNDRNKRPKIEVTLQDIADFILKQPDERVVCMLDAKWNSEFHKGHGCIMVHYGLEELGIDEPFHCGNNEWYSPRRLPKTMLEKGEDIVFAKIKDDHSHTGLADYRHTMIFDVAYGKSDLSGYADVVTDADYWPFDKITYGELKDNLLEKYYDVEKDTHKPTRNPA